MSTKPLSTGTTDRDRIGVEERIFGELAYLRSLFERRLLADKTKDRAFNELFEQLDFARQSLVQQFLLPIILDVVLICDRLERAAERDESLLSIVDEILEAFFRRGLTEIEWEGAFDPRFHDMVEAVSVSDESQDHCNIDLQRRGFTFGELVVRPARVLVGKYEAGPSASGPADSEDHNTSGELQTAVQDDLDSTLTDGIESG